MIGWAGMIGVWLLGGWVVGWLSSKLGCRSMVNPQSKSESPKPRMGIISYTNGVHEHCFSVIRAKGSF